LFLLAGAKRNRFHCQKFQWFTKISSKKDHLNVITKQDIEKRQSISLLPVPIFLIKLGQENM
jgi:ethanolamine utilization protein EutP (predicted NTPase)